MKRRNPHKRRFTTTAPTTAPRLYALAQIDDEHPSIIIEDDTMPLGVTPPSPTCLPDSVLALICPKCLSILYISRGMYSALRYAQSGVEQLAPGQISWFNPQHRPCHAIMRKISLAEDVVDDVVEADPD